MDVCWFLIPFFFLAWTCSSRWRRLAHRGARFTRIEKSTGGSASPSHNDPAEAPASTEAEGPRKASGRPDHSPDATSPSNGESSGANVDTEDLLDFRMAVARDSFASRQQPARFRWRGWRQEAAAQRNTGENRLIETRDIRDELTRWEAEKNELRAEVHDCVARVETLCRQVEQLLENLPQSKMDRETAGSKTDNKPFSDFPRQLAAFSWKKRYRETNRRWRVLAVVVLIAFGLAASWFMPQHVWLQSGDMIRDTWTSLSDWIRAR